MTDRAEAKDYLSEQRVVRVVEWPGVNRHVGVLVLNCAEVQDAMFEARSHYDRKRQPVDMMSEVWFTNEIEYQLVRRMLIDPDSKRPEDRVFGSTAQLRKLMIPDLVQWFLDQHAEAKDGYARELGLIEQGPDDAE